MNPRRQGQFPHPDQPPGQFAAGCSSGFGLGPGAFLLSHFGNHALGLFSIDAMESGRWAFNLAWHNPVGTTLLYGSLLLHFVLALEALFKRRTLRMPLKEATQLVLGLSIPFLLIPHVVATRVDFALTARDVGYPSVIRGLWILAPENGVRQVIALLIAWLHGCLGIYFWIRAKSWYPRYGMLLYTGAVLISVLALLGFAEAGKSWQRTQIASRRQCRHPLSPNSSETSPSASIWVL